MTNGDKIRQMTDEELAEILMCPYDDCGKMLENCEKFKDVNRARRCQECSKAWLKREAEE